MKRILSVLTCLSALIVQAYEVALDSYDTRKSDGNEARRDRRREHVIDTLVKHISDTDIMIVENRTDEMWRDKEDGKIDYLLSYTLKVKPVRFCTFVKGNERLSAGTILYLYENKYRSGLVGPSIRTIAPLPKGDPRRWPSYLPSLAKGDMPRLVFVKKQQKYLKDYLFKLYWVDSPIYDDAMTLSEPEFMRKYHLESVFSNRVYRVMDECVFHVDYPVPDLPETESMKLNRHITDVWKKRSEEAVYTTENTGLIHLSPEEISEIVYIACRMDKKSGGHKAYMEACAREPKVLLPMDEKKPVFKTAIGIALRDALRKKAEDEKKKEEKEVSKENPRTMDSESDKKVARETELIRRATERRLAEKARKYALLGNGYPGSLLPYPETPELQKLMSKYGLTAGYFQRREKEDGVLLNYEPCFPTNSIPYLLYKPKPGREPVPLVLYFGGNGEHGTNLVDQFRQPLVFEKVTSPDFQRRHPCYLFAPMHPKGANFGAGIPGSPGRQSDLTCDALYAVIRSLDNPPVDTNRLYVTGLSFGGMATHRLLWLYPGRFAAGVPAEYMVRAWDVPTPPPNCWFLCGEGEEEYRDMRKKNASDNIKAVREAGGDCRVSMYPESGHNSWEKAWREDSVWEWMFSKTLDGRPVPRKAGVSTAAGAALPVQLPEARVCTASVPGEDAAHGPAYAADGLDNTCYRSAQPVKTGDWWMIDFSVPVKGTVVVHSGTLSGEGILKTGRVETSANGTIWTRAGVFSAKNGTCRIPLTAPIRYLRVLPENRKPETLILRNLVFTP